MMKEKERLDKILANSGFGSRRDVKRLVRYGEVLINGVQVRDPEFHIDVDNDKVVINGEPLVIEKHSYFMMNKAGGAVCSTKSDRHQTVYEFLDAADNQKMSFVYIGGANQVQAFDDDILSKMYDTLESIIFIFDYDTDGRSGAKQVQELIDSGRNKIKILYDST